MLFRSREVRRCKHLSEPGTVTVRVVPVDRVVRRPSRCAMLRSLQIGEVFDWPAQTVDRLVPDVLAGPPESNEVQAVTAPLQVKQLIQDKRLGKPREAVHDDNEVDPSSVLLTAVQRSPPSRTGQPPASVSLSATEMFEPPVPRFHSVARDYFTWGSRGSDRRVPGDPFGPRGKISGSAKGGEPAQWN